jgi:tRNA-specific 2-thiouridylase
VPDGDHTKIIRQRLGNDAPALSVGPFVLSDGTAIGNHDGFARFTIGQRRGLPGGFRVPMFVVAIRPSDRAVVIGPREELLGRGVIARSINWLVDAPPVGAQVEIQIRHHSPAAKAEIVRVDGDEIELALDEPVSAIAPGQSLVVYDGERVLGGGLIERASGQRTPLPVRAA